MPAGMVHLYFFIIALGLLPYLGAIMLPGWGWIACGFLLSAVLFCLFFAIGSVAGQTPLVGLFSFVAVAMAAVFLWGLAVRSVAVLFDLRVAPAIIVYVIGFAPVVAGPQLLALAVEIFKIEVE
jgi:hypothetical protein